MNAVTTTTHPAELFRAEDRCDRCSAAARVLVLLHSGGELVFCHHHANKYRSGLGPIALMIEHPESGR